MRVKKFTAHSMQEAVAQLRDEFGRDAVILHTKQKRKGLFGRFGKSVYEVIGAIDPAAASEARTPSAPKRAESQPQETARPAKANNVVWPESLDNVYQRLLSVGIPQEEATVLLKDALRLVPNNAWNDPTQVRDALTQALANQIPTVDPWSFENGQQVAVFIGPTGVGKTTTVAKLAANFALVANRKVGVITTDTYRIAAVDQLKTYADIIGIPLEVAFSPKELRTAMAKFTDRDLILVDTAGRSPKNELQIVEMKNYFEGLNAEMHLVMSASTKERDVARIVEVFSELCIDRLIVTKLDETTSYGIMLQISSAANAPIAFITTGQGVPEDIEVADGSQIARLILGDWE